MTTSFQPSSKASSPSERDEGHFNQEKGLISDSNVICGDQHKTSPLLHLMHLSLDSRTQNMLSKQCVDDMFYMMTKRQKMIPPPPLLSLGMRLKGCQEVHEDSMEDQRLHIPYPSRDRLNGQLPRVKHERKCTRISGLLLSRKLSRKITEGENYCLAWFRQNAGVYRDHKRPRQDNNG